MNASRKRKTEEARGEALPRWGLKQSNEREAGAMPLWGVIAS